MNSIQLAEIAVVIVNFNTAAMTLKAVESILARSHHGRSVEVHIVDNSSPDGDAATISAALAERDWSARVRLRCEVENHGFGRANNLILRELANRDSPPRYVFLLNPDAQLQNEAIAILADFLDSRPMAAAAGAKVSRPDGSAVSAAFRFPGLISTFASAMALGPSSRLMARWLVPMPKDTATQRVDWVVGAAVMFRLSSIEEVGFFDPGYFLYYEEVDLMRRLARTGGVVWHVAEARVVHAEGAATGLKSGTKRRRLPAYWYRSWRHYFLTNHGRGYALAAAVAWITGAAVNQVLAFLRGRSPAAPLHFYRDFWGYAVSPLLDGRPAPRD